MLFLFTFVLTDVMVLSSVYRLSTQYKVIEYINPGQLVKRNAGNS